MYDVHEFPLNADALVLIYTIPGIDTQVSSTPTLILDRYCNSYTLLCFSHCYAVVRDTIVKIYQGQITTWNDPAIVALNPALNEVL